MLSRLKPLVRALAAAVAAVLFIAVSPNVAKAATGPDGWIGYNTGWYPNGHQLGTYLPDGYTQRSVCLDISYSGHFMAVPSAPTVATTIYDPVIAWALNAYGQSQNPAYTAALNYFVGVRINSNPTEVQAAWDELAGHSASNYASAVAALNDIQNNAASYAGPYSTDLALNPDPTNWHGTVGSVGVRPAGPGNTWAYVPYTPVTVTLIGPAVFDATGTSTISGQSDGWGGLIGVNLAWHATGAGTVVVAEDISGVSLTYTLFPAAGANIQRMATGTGPETLHAEDPASANPTQATVTSHLQRQLVDGTWADADTVRVNDTIRDTVRITGGEPASTVSLDWSAQTSASPFSASNTSGTVIGQGTVQVVLDGDGAGSVVLPFVLPVGYLGYVGVDTYLHASGGQLDVDPPIFDTGETAPVVKYAPKVDSLTSRYLVGAASTIHDQVVVTEARPNTPFTCSSVLYGPFPVQVTGSATVPADAPIVGTAACHGTTDASGAATVITDSLTVPSATGFYVWVETLDAMADGATVVSDAVVGTFARTTETSLNMAPTVSTQVSSQAVIPNTRLTDTATVAGIFVGVGGLQVTSTMDVTLYGPVAPVTVSGVPSCTGVDWAGAPVAATQTGVAVDHDGAYSALGVFTPTVEGCYSYSETLTVVSQAVGSDGTTPAPIIVAHPVGQVTQTTLVARPTAVTVTSSQVADAGDQVFDTITVSGTGGNTGTILAALVGPVDPGANHACSSVTQEQWTAAFSGFAASTVQSVPVSGDGEYTTSPVTLSSTGCYSWVERLTIAGHPDAGSDTPIGVASETTVVVAPAISTVAHMATTYTPTDVTDSIIVSGTYGQAGVLRGALYGPVAPVTAADGSATCAGVDWASAPVTGAFDDVATSGDGTYVTSPIRVTNVGCYTFKVTFALEAADVTPVGHDVGVAAETVEAVASADEASDGGIDSGVPGLSANPSAVGVALVLALLAAGVGVAAFREVRRAKGVR